jgi:hypothetical protein
VRPLTALPEQRHRQRAAPRHTPSPANTHTHARARTHTHVGLPRRCLRCTSRAPRPCTAWRSAGPRPPPPTTAAWRARRCTPRPACGTTSHTRLPGALLGPAAVRGLVHVNATRLVHAPQPQTCLHSCRVLRPSWARPAQHRGAAHSHLGRARAPCMLQAAQGHERCRVPGRRRGRAPAQHSQRGPRDPRRAQLRERGARARPAAVPGHGACHGVNTHVCVCVCVCVCGVAVEA